MELWIAFTIAAAFFQNLRSAMQKHLQGRLSTLGAAYVRFVYALPIAALPRTPPSWRRASAPGWSAGA